MAQFWKCSRYLFIMMILIKKLGVDKKLYNIYYIFSFYLTTDNPATNIP
jgi:hypothetical protein